MRKMCQKSCENVGDVFFFCFFIFKDFFYFLRKPIISRGKYCKNQNTYMGLKMCKKYLVLSESESPKNIRKAENVFFCEILLR